MKTLTIKTFAVLLTAFAAITMLDSCKKEPVTPPASTSKPAGLSTPSTLSFQIVNQALIDGLTSIFSTGKHAFKNQGINDALSSCATITVDSSKTPYYVKTYDFGTGCTGSDGHFRSGKIVVTFNSMNFKQAGDTATLDLSTYTCDSLQFAGGLAAASYTDGSGYLNYYYQLNMSATINGTTYPATGHLNWQWVAGMNSSPASNLQFVISGSYHGYDKSGNAESTVISNPLVRNFYTPGCNSYIQGTVDITNAAGTSTVDFGSGTCTGMETVTQGGKSSYQAQ